MQPNQEWTEGQDATIRRMRMDGRSWDDIAETMRLHRSAVIGRACRIGAADRSRTNMRGADDPWRGPLPAGHPRSWGALTEGTSLEGVPYPLYAYRIH